MADTTIDLLKNSSYVGKMDELIAAVKLGSGATSDVEWDNVKNKPTTIGGYGITDAKIENGTITLGNQTITPLTSAPVTSVNSKTGAVTLSAADVSAIPSTLTGTAGQVLTKTADGQEWKDVDIPTALPNPNALTFTGAVTGSYDGSAPLSVEIPSGGGSSGSALPGLVYSHTCDGTYVSVTDEVPLEDNKIYFIRFTIPEGSSKSTFRCLIGGQGNSYTGAVAGIITDQHAVVKKQTHAMVMKLENEIVGISYFGANIPESTGYSLGQNNGNKLGSKIYLFSQSADVNLPDGAKVEVYKLN